MVASVKHLDSFNTTSELCNLYEPHTSGSVLDEISVRSPRRLLISIILEIIFGSEYPKNTFYLILEIEALLYTFNRPIFILVVGLCVTLKGLFVLQGNQFAVLIFYCSRALLQVSNDFVQFCLTYQAIDSPCCCSVVQGHCFKSLMLQYVCEVL